MSRLFGTDGIRGIANKELTCDFAMNVGIASALVLSKNNVNNIKVIIGNDGRESADMLVSGIISGLLSVGVSVINIGIIPTPAISYLVKYYEASAGIMVTASHNPYNYNGIKIFNSDGYKLDDSIEDEIEACLKNKIWEYKENIGKINVSSDSRNIYINHLKSCVSGNLNGLNIAIDCANGASSVIAPKLFTDLGINCHILNDKPNGKNINLNCGSLHIEQLAKYVVQNKLDAGVAFDGDADRAIFVDEKGNVIDGDFVLSILANYLSKNNKLNNNTIVGTIMSNLGLMKFCEKNNYNFIKTKVGDRYVLEEMLRNNYSLGGEQSGHVIIKEYANTGDGELTAICLFSALVKSNLKLSNLASIMKKYPQALVNLNIPNDIKNNILDNKEIKLLIDEVNNKLGNSGRLVIRPSGTEPLIRIMIEGEDESYINNLVNDLANKIKSIIN